jgi:outer membrane protein assembly factor BamB
MKFSLLVVLLFVSVGLNANNWPSFGGQFRNQYSEEEGLRTDWGEEEPKTLWKLEVGLGYSSIIEVDGLAYTQGNSDGRNTLFCVQADSGKILWRHSYPCSKAPKYFDGGSRATPVVANEVLLLCSHEGDFYALDSKSGKILWTKNLVEDLNGKRPTWGYSGSPLVVGEKLIVETGSENGSLHCLNLKTGDLVWKSGESEAGYASPMLYGEAPSKVLVFNESGIVIHDLDSGKIQKKYQHKTRYGINASQPLIFGKKALISSAYGKGSALVDLTRKMPSAVWESESYSCQMASMVRKGKYSFGIHGQAGGRSDQSKLFCLDLESGKERWKEVGFGLGTVLLVRDTLVILSDRGELCLAQANQNKFTELARFQVLSGKNIWTPPTYVNGRMHCRNPKGQWVCLQMRKAI